MLTADDLRFARAIGLELEDVADLRSVETFIARADMKTLRRLFWLLVKRWRQL